MSTSRMDITNTIIKILEIINLKLDTFKAGMVVQAYNPCYLGGDVQENLI
jgi:hypothetical protein